MGRSSVASLVIIADVGPDQFHVGDEAMLEANVEALRRFCPSARVAVLGRGKVIAVGTIAELLQSQEPWIREYFHGTRGEGRAAAASARRPQARRMSI